MKIAVFFHDGVAQSGATQSMLTLVNNWHNRGVEILAFSPHDDTLFMELRKMGIRCICLPMGNSRYNKSRNLFRRVEVRLYSLLTLCKLELYVKHKLVGLLKSEGVDVVYANSSACVVGYYIKKHSDFSLIWHIREFGDLDQNVGFVGGKKCLFRMISTSDLVIYISKAIESYYKKGVNAKKSILVYDDVTINYDSYIERDWSKHPISILSCGALNPGKGHMDVIRACADVVKQGYDIELFIAGKGDMYLPMYIDLIKELELESRVHMLGQVTDMKSLREKCHIGVVASKMEAFGRVTVEGMLSGLTMVGAASGGTDELIEDNVTGLKFQAGNDKELSEKIIFLINNVATAQSIARRGYVYSTRFVKENCATVIYDELKKFVDE